MRKYCLSVAAILGIATIALGLVGIVFFVTPTTLNQNITNELGRFLMTTVNINLKFIISSDRSSYSDNGLLYIYPWQQPVFQIFTQSINAIDVTSVTLSRLKVKQYQCN